MTVLRFVVCAKMKNVCIHWQIWTLKNHCSKEYTVWCTGYTLCIFLLGYIFTTVTNWHTAGLVSSQVDN